MIPGRRTAEGQLVITAGPPLSTDPRMAGFAMKPTGEVYASGGQSAFTPADLFLNGEQGAWYDPSDLSTMFQDREGITPVTADGQTVGKILDKSGRGNHAVAPSDSARPLYKTDGTYHWLQFDGVDDALSTTDIDFSSTDKMSVFAGSLSVAPNGGIVTGFLAVPSFAVLYNSNIRTDLKDVCKSSVAASLSTKYVSSTALDSVPPTVLEQTHTRINGSEVLNSVVADSPASGNQGTYRLVLGDWLDVLKLNGNLYSIIVRGALSTPDEITETETWVNGKTGAY